MFHPINSCEGLHPDNVNWARYLASCDILSSNGVWTHYAGSNCHYIVHSPTKLVYSGVYGYHGFNLYNALIKNTTQTLCNMLDEGMFLADLFSNPKKDVDRIDRVLAILYKTV